MRMFYQGEELSSWRFIEEHAPWMPGYARMLRMTAHDPAGVAMFFDLQMKLFCKHVLGVLQMGTLLNSSVGSWDLSPRSLLLSRRRAVVVFMGISMCTC